ncbi:MAG: serine/threonine-protein kinase [Phycisphaerales bacterium]|nr:serine/threonine-protein kinase [Phycisphaerales bacterium]
MTAEHSKPDLSEPENQGQEAETQLPCEATADSILPGEGHSSIQMPDRIGPYKISAIIGQGGMGTVYKAMQESPRRAVALKVVKRGVVSRSARKRFEYEAQTLGRLRHENIAQIYEAGTHESDGGSQPYFAMEYIPNARSITEYAQEKNLGTRERLALFSKVCEALQHGHQKGIIHRDLKPGNILVTGNGVPKVIDFGVARSTDSDMAFTTLRTEVGQLIGTLQYMSPEQCEADPADIDTRSDVYALGMVLYELLTDTPAYDLKNAAIHEAVRVIREEEPTRLSSVNRSLRGDIETMTFKALQKNRDFRYQSATELGQDIARYLRDEPIAARPLGAIGIMRRSIRKHKVVATSAAIILMVLVASGITIMIYATEQARQKREAAMMEQSSAQLLKMAGYLTDEVGVGPRSTPEQREKVAIINSLDYKVEQLFLGILKTTQETLGTDHPHTMEASANLAYLYSTRDQFDKAFRYYQATLDISRRILGEEHPETINRIASIGSFFYQQARYNEAEEYLTEAIQIARGLQSDQYSRTWEIVRLMGWVLRSQQRYEEAMPYFLESLDASRQKLGEDDVDVIRLKEDVGDLFQLQGQYSQAQSYLDGALNDHRRLHGRDSHYYISVLEKLTWLYAQWHEAEPEAGHDGAASMYQSELNGLNP